MVGRARRAPLFAPAALAFAPVIQQVIHTKNAQYVQQAAHVVKQRGGEIQFNARVVGLNSEGTRITSVIVEEAVSGTRKELQGDVFISSMPVRELIAALGPTVPEEVREIASGLLYRDFMTVGLLLRKTNFCRPNTIHPDDNWLYIQEQGVRVGRIQIFNNWSPHMVADADTAWIGLEYFVSETDELWRMDDAEVVKFATQELESIKFAASMDLLDAVVIRMLNTTIAAHAAAVDRMGFRTTQR